MSSFFRCLMTMEGDKNVEQVCESISTVQPGDKLCSGFSLQQSNSCYESTSSYSDEHCNTNVDVDGKASIINKVTINWRINCSLFFCILTSQTYFYHNEMSHLYKTANTTLVLHTLLLQVILIRLKLYILSHWFMSHLSLDWCLVSRIKKGKCLCQDDE